MSEGVPDGYQCCTRMGFYCADPPLTNFWYGCLAYVVFAAVACLICYFTCGAKNRGVAVYAAIVGTFCLWLMWSMTWLSQWHPLVYPQYTPEEDQFGKEYNGSYTICTNETTVDTIYWLGDGSTST